MIRTVIGLEPEEKAWVDQLAAKEHVSMATVIRDAIHHYRQELETEQRPSFTELLKKTQGIAEMEDGLQYQIDIRKEWDKQHHVNVNRFCHSDRSFQWHPASN